MHLLQRQQRLEVTILFGIVLREGNYKNNFKEGVWKEYTDKGVLHEQSTYVAGNLQGVYKEFYASGKVRQEGNYKDDQKDGTWKYYDASGKLTAEVIYEKGNRIKTVDYE